MRRRPRGAGARGQCRILFPPPNTGISCGAVPLDRGRRLVGLPPLSKSVNSANTRAGRGTRADLMRGPGGPPHNVFGIPVSRTVCGIRRAWQPRPHSCSRPALPFRAREVPVKDRQRSCRPRADPLIPSAAFEQIAAECYTMQHKSGIKKWLHRSRFLFMPTTSPNHRES